MNSASTFRVHVHAFMSSKVIFIKLYILSFSTLPFPSTKSSYKWVCKLSPEIQMSISFLKSFYDETMSKTLWRHLQSHISSKTKRCISMLSFHLFPENKTFLVDHGDRLHSWICYILLHNRVVLNLVRFFLIFWWREPAHLGYYLVCLKMRLVSCLAKQLQLSSLSIESEIPHVSFSIALSHLGILDDSF